jgi:hypothetical protein
LYSAGAAYCFLASILRAGLVEVVRARVGNTRNRRLLVSEKGREFLRAYKICVSLFPEAQPGDER